MWVTVGLIFSHLGVLKYCFVQVEKVVIICDEELVLVNVLTQEAKFGFIFRENFDTKSRKKGNQQMSDVDHFTEFS